MYSLASLIVELQSARRRLLKTFLKAMPTTEPPTYDAASVLARKNHALGGIGVGAGVGFAGEPEAGWLCALPAPKTRARIISKTIRMTECIR
jgi:hypothetical protein